MSCKRFFFKLHPYALTFEPVLESVLLSSSRRFLSLEQETILLVCFPVQLFCSHALTSIGNTTDLFIWNASVYNSRSHSPSANALISIEINLVIIAACIPSLRPLFINLFGGTVSSKPPSRALSASTSRKNFIPIVILPYDRFHALGPQPRASTVDQHGWSDGDSEKDTLPGNKMRTTEVDVESQHIRTSVHFSEGSKKDTSVTSSRKGELVGLAY